MARKNPTITTTTPNDEVVEGVDRLPIASGKNMKAMEQANAMPEVNMSENNGDNPSIGSAPFANGKDVRAYGSSPSSNPCPAKPGC